MSIELIELEEIQDRKEEYDEETYMDMLKSKGISNESELLNRISKLQSKVNLNTTLVSNEAFDENKKWPLINTPDEDLNESQLKQKKIQKLQRLSYLSRLEKKELLKKEKEKIENFKKNDPDGYLFSLLLKKKESLDKIEKYKRIRKEMQSRRTKNNLSRMMVMAELGKEKEKTKVKTRRKDKEKEDLNDDFGKNDDDWEVYRGIAKNTFSDEEEEEKNNLEEIEEMIIEIKPDYIFTSEIGNYINESDLSSSLYLGIDQFRGVEILFKPYIVGIDKAGLSETIECVVKQFNKEDQRKLLGNVFLCGGNMSYRNIDRRIYNEIRGFADYDIDIKVNKAGNMLNDCWNGLKKFHYEVDDVYKISKEEYEEKGVNYFKWNRYSNLPISKVN
jgi:actin-related protein 5